MKLITLLLLCVLVIGCESDPAETPATPTAPAPPAPTLRALLQPVGVFTFPGCTFQSTCTFAATVVNNGAGCGYQVTGTTRLFDTTGLQLGGPYRWSLPPGQLVQPGERVAYAASFVPFDQAVRVFTYLTDVNWIDTPCR